MSRRYRRARYVSVLECGDDFFRLRHEVSGVIAYVPERAVRAWLSLPSDRFEPLADVIVPLAEQGFREDTLGALFDALVGGGLVDTPDARVELGFDALASIYDACPPHPPRVMEVLAAHTEAEHWDAVLDLGTGPGTLLEALAACAPGTLHAVDVSPRMVERARALCEAHGIDARVQCARAEALPFLDDTFGLVVIGAAHGWFDAAPAWAEIRRVLRPDGRVVLLSTMPGEVFFEALRAHEIPGRRKPLAADLGTTMQGLPDYVAVQHFERVRSEVTVRTPIELAAWAATFAPTTSDDCIWEGLEGFTEAPGPWPRTIPCVSPVAVLEMLV